MQRRQVQRLQRRAVNVQRLAVATCGEKANQNRTHGMYVHVLSMYVQYMHGASLLQLLSI